MAEGVDRDNDDYSAVTDYLVNGSIHCDRFARLWDSINGEGAWEKNPWVWVIEFKEAKP